MIINEVRISLQLFSLLLVTNRLCKPRSESSLIRDAKSNDFNH